jgi:hypothetical protein
MDTQAHERPELSLRSLRLLLFAGFGIGGSVTSLFSEVFPVSNVFPVFLSVRGQKTPAPLRGRAGTRARPDDRGDQRRPVTPNTTLLWKVRQ